VTALTGRQWKAAAKLAAQDDSRLVLNCFLVSPTNIVMADGFVLGIVGCENTIIGSDKPVIIPIDFCDFLDHDDVVESFDIEKRWSRVRSEKKGKTIYKEVPFKSNDGEFVDYHQVIRTFDTYEDDGSNEFALNSHLVQNVLNLAKVLHPGNNMAPVKFQSVNKNAAVKWTIHGEDNDAHGLIMPAQVSW
jgi:hypothetical protein